MRRCPACSLNFREATDLMEHIQEEHPSAVPKKFTLAQYDYYIRTGKLHGSCVICKQPTGWNEKTGKYHRFCKNPKCKETYVKEFRNRMIGKYGKVTLLDDPEHQRKMLANRSISGVYTWSDGSKKINYTGSYELDFLRFMDLFMEFDSDDIMSPSPHTYYYFYEGKKRFYIPDFFIPSLNLEVEVKDGALNRNRHHKIEAVDRVKEKLKDAVLLSQKNFSYIKIYDKQYDNFIDLLMKMKESIQENGEPKQFFYIKDWNEQPTTSREQYIESIKESYIAHVHGNDIEVLESAIQPLKDGENEFLQNELLITLENHLHVIKTYDYILKKVKEYDDELQVDYITTPHLGFELTYPGFIHSEIGYMIKELIQSYDQTPFRRRIINKAKNVKEGKKHFLRDLEVCKYVLKNCADRYPSKKDFFYENYCWIENVIMENAVTIGGEEAYPVYVLLTHTGTVLSNVIKNVTKKDYSHASISFDPKLTEMYSFGRKYKNNPLIGTFVIENIRSGLFGDLIDQTTYSLYVTFVTKEEYDMMKERLNSFLDKKHNLKYNFTGLIKHGLGKESARDDAFFCSQFVDTILSSGRQYFNKHSSLVKPTDFAEHKDFHFVSKGLLRDYDPSYTFKKTELIASSIKKIKKDRSGVAYIPLTKDDIKRGWVDFSVEDKLFVPTTYKALKKFIKTTKTEGIYTHYMVYPLDSLPFKITDKNDIAVIMSATPIKITNKNLI